jgi:molybdate transport system substrate-binding protein
MGPEDRPRRRHWISLALLGLILCQGSFFPVHAREPLHIFAAASTIAPVTETSRLFSKLQGIAIIPVIASSGALARQIAAGAPAQLFLTADPKWLDWAVAQKVIDKKSRLVFLRNRLVLAAPKGSADTFKITEGFDLVAQLGNRRIAIADPAHAPLGTYSRAALRWLGAWKGIAKRALRLSDAAQARVMVERGEAAYGILYASDVIRNPRLKSAGYFPLRSHPAIRYEIALTRNGAKNADARAFLNWLQDTNARKVFLKHGFGVQ